MTFPQEYVDYTSTLPKHTNKGVAWTIESFTTAVSILFPGYEVVPGQEWSGAFGKYDFICPKHGAYTTIANSVLRSKHGSCMGCRNEASAARNAAQRAALVGTTTADGHVILEHVGYYYETRANKKNKRHAKFRYKCARCGNEQAIAHGRSLNTPGNTIGCTSCSQDRRECIAKHLRNKKWANSLCQYYIATVDDDLLLKLGISNDYERRATQGPDPDRWYTSPLFISQKYPRCWVWTAEQIILKESEHARAPIPERWGEKWGGQSELRQFHLDVDEVVMRFYELMEEIAVDGFHAVYKKYTNKTNTPFNQ